MTATRILPIRILFLAAAAVAPLLGGCHPKTAPTPANFTQTLNAYFLDHPDCLFPQAPRFPFETSDPIMTKQLDSLVKMQLLDVAREPAIHVSRYTPTVAGTRAAPRFCFGHRVVSSIDSFTAPAQKNGFPETLVSYRYFMEDVPVWAKPEQVQAVFPKLISELQGTPSGTATLAGTMAGWQVPD